MGKWEKVEDESHLYRCCSSEENTKIQTITRKILKDASNGQKIITEKLDTHIKPNKEYCQDRNVKNAMDFAMEVDFTGIMDPNSTIQCRTLFDILDVSESLKMDIEDVITHPVMALFIWSKWQKVKKFYYFMAFCYFLFLVSFTDLLYSMFGQNFFDLSGKNYFMQYCITPKKMPINMS